MFSNCSYPYHSRTQELPHNETGSGAVRPSGLSREAGAAAPYAALQFLASGQGTTVAREQHLHGMDAVRQQLGNRAFMYWVGLLHAAGHGGQAQADAMQGRPDPAGSAPLQCMPKKRRQKEAAGKVTPEGQTQAAAETGAPGVPGATAGTPPGAVAQAGVEAAVTQPQGEATGTAVAEAAVTQPQAEATETAVAGEKKKKKKSRVQVALNTLRSEGVGAFKDYLEARFDETALLDTLAERVQRAQDLAGVREAALGAVQTRLRTLDPMAVADLPQASAPDPELVVEGAAVTPVKTSPTVQDAAPDVARARRRALDPKLIAGLPQASAPDPEQVAEGAAVAPVKTSLTLQEGVLFISCVRGSVGQFEFLLRSGPVDINMMSSRGTLLYTAALHNHPAIVKVLLSRPNIKVNLGDPSGATPLFAVARLGHLEVARMLLSQSGIDVNLGDSSGATPLAAAVQFGHLEVAGMLLQHPKINPSIGTSEYGTTPLPVAAYCGHKKMVKLLLSSGKVNVNLRDKNGGTALFVAVQRNWPKIVKHLIKAGADVNQPLKDGRTPLCVAVLEGYVKVVELLLQAPGVQVNKPGPDDTTPLHFACVKGYMEIVRLLLNKGADPDMATRYGITALHIACIAGDTKIVELLLNNKADPNIADATGMAAIHHVCVAGHTKILKMLLDAGADTGLKAEGEYTPYRIASAAAHQEVMKLLEVRSQRPAGPAAQLESLPREKQAEQTKPETVPGGGARAGAGTDGKAQAVSKSGGPSQTATGSQPGVTETRSPLEQAKREFRQDILMRLEDERIDSLDGIRLLEAVNEVADLDGLYGIYHRLAGIERKTMRTRSRPSGRKSAPMKSEAKPHEISGFILGDKANLDAGAVEAEIRNYLAPAHHKFISQAVNDMEFGRGKPTPGYPDLLHVSVGIAGVGSCCVFFHVDAGARTIRIAGIGRLLDPETCRLDYAAAGLRGLRKVRLS